MSRAVRELARAKINLFLRVKSRREDGYHDLESLVLPISLADALVAEEAETISLSVQTAPGVEATPAGPDNLVVTAALALAEIAQPPHGAAIELIKRIPVAAGLGGGSADAAAVLHALNDLWSVGLSEEALRELGSAIGSDIPALLMDGPSLVRGRGEVIEPAGVAEMVWVIVPMPFEVRTPDAFGWWDEHAPASGGEPSRVLAAAASGSLEELAAVMFNDLEAPVIARHPEIGEVKQQLIEAGAIGAIMCGSGPTVAALTAGPDEAFHVRAAVPEGTVVLAPALRSKLQWDDGDGAL